MVCSQNGNETFSPDFELLDWIPRQSALIWLGIDEVQLRRDQAVLLELVPAGFDYKKRDPGFSVSAFRVLWEFRKLVREQGRKRAIAQINSVMENLSNE